METRRCLLVDAFATEPLAGNAAGVVPDAAGLDDAQMQAIARELNASETAFLTSSDEADRRIRYFTPTQEVDLCGHATVASHAWLAESGEIDDGTHTLETNVGVVEVTVDEGSVWMTQDDAVVEAVDLDHGRVAEVLGADPATLRDVGADLPLATASTGLGYLVVPVNFLSALSELAPDFDAVAALTDELGVTGVYAFTFDTLDADSTLHGRSFVPLAGIPEDPVTGTASGAVAAYLRRHGALETPDPVVCEQGHFLDRPGRVLVRTGYGSDDVDGAGDPDAEGIVPAPEVGGHATVTLEGELRVPPSDDEGIIEA